MRKVNLKLIVPLLVLTLLVWLFREPLREKIRNHATMANDDPSPEVVADMIEQSSDPRAALLEAWNSGRVVPREVALQSFTKQFPANQTLPADLHDLLLSAALDPDSNVRELALGILQQRDDPALPALAAEQLRDCDEAVRMLGLNYLKYASPNVGIPRVAALLDDPDIAVLGMSIKLLGNWSGQNFGVKIADAVQEENPTNGLLEFQPAGVAKTKTAAAKAKAWWAERQNEYPPARLEVPSEALGALHPVPAADFTLPTVDGRKVRLSDFRGKVVLLNFWTTWCTACVGEIPALVALQKEHPDDVVILGVSLDTIPDEHGQIGGDDAANQKSGAGVESDNDQKITPVALKRIRAKVARTVSVRGINYTVLLDEHDDAGGRYNGGELPTTVIVDAKGYICRRFIGARSLSVFEAMLAQARQPLPGNSSTATQKLK